MLVTTDRPLPVMSRYVCKSPYNYVCNNSAWPYIVNKQAYNSIILQGKRTRGDIYLICPLIRSAVIGVNFHRLCDKSKNTGEISFNFGGYCLDSWPA